MPPRGRPKKGEGGSAGSGLEALVLEKVKSSGNAGLTEKEIAASLPEGTDAAKRANVYNTLLKKAKIQLKRRASDGALLYTLAGDGVHKLAGLNVSETALYQCIKETQNKGIWSRDLKMRLNLPKMQHDNALKALEKRKLIKTVKSANQKNKKIYMLYELQPDQELTGGPWFNDQHEYDEEFIRIIYDQVLKFVKEKPYASVQEISDKLNSSGVFKDRLLNDNVEQLLGTMVYDGALMEFSKYTADNWETPKLTYYEPKSIPAFNSLTETPCGVCPVISHCAPGGDISPETCKYIDQWLNGLDW